LKIYFGKHIPKKLFQKTHSRTYIIHSGKFIPKILFSKTFSRNIIHELGKICLGNIPKKVTQTLFSEIDGVQEEFL